MACLNSPYSLLSSQLLPLVRQGCKAGVPVPSRDRLWILRQREAPAPLPVGYCHSFLLELNQRAQGGHFHMMRPELLPRKREICFLALLSMRSSNLTALNSEVPQLLELVLFLDRSVQALRGGP